MSGDSEAEERWESFYRECAPDKLPWESGRPDGGLVELVESGRVEKGRVLDICSGLGTQSIYLAKQGFEVYGVDISYTAVRLARKRCRSEGVVCNLTLGDAATLKYVDGFFTFVFDRGCFHSLKPEEREKFIRGVHRVLKKNGKYSMKCFSWRNGAAPNHFTEDDIRRYFSKHFKILEIRDEVFRENVSGGKVYLYSTLMERNDL